MIAAQQICSPMLNAEAVTSPKPTLVMVMIAKYNA